ncbi:MAG: sigma-54-dependent Fis family transcriptional regulator [Acidobacteria bacterium]|nr:sigma-54-dependent Fis family transcriptional regulator [Acidobacteriota bacterium]
MTDAIKVLVVDDEPGSRYGMRRALQRDKYVLSEAPDGAAAITMIEQDRPDLVFLDLNMPGLDGLEVLRKSQARPHPPIVVIVTAHGSERTAVEAMKLGAFDYLTKPYDIDELRAIARNAADRIGLARENEHLRRQLRSYTEFGSLLGGSEAMRRVYDLIERVAKTDLTVLIRGESGTGKELVARELHGRSHRADGPFLAMNCAALPDTLIESELFGHERGAFSGADQRRRGKLEAAHHGTLFLDEVGDMSLGTQAKLLRALQERQFERVGSNDSIRVDVRFVAATNKDLARETAEGRFRQDLLYRLQVVEIALPPLRDRRDDIPQLASAFLEEAIARHQPRARRFSPAAVDALRSQSWPGNVRELRNTVERAAALARGEAIEPDDLAPVDGGTRQASATPPPDAAFGQLQDLPYHEARRRAIESFERAYLERRLSENDWNISRTAAAMGMHRQSLQQKVKELGIIKK